MNILIITEKDAANASMSRIANSLKKKGHSIRVYAPYYTDALLKGFDKGIDKFPYSEIGKEAYEWCDIIFATSIAVAFLNKEELLRLHKPIFTHNYLINGQINWGGDLCFVSSLETSETDYDDSIVYSRFAIGEPKYDSTQNDLEGSATKKFLFIDSGHFPFGTKGKRELAKTLLSICEANPEYELVIKPRFLPGDTVITHRNLLTLYDVLLEETKGILPSNMNYLDKHYDLMELIENSDVVVCLYTTAFVGAYVANKGLVILDGLESDDVYDVRCKSFMRIRKNMEYTNALVDYKKVNDYLPEGVKADSRVIKQLFAEKEDVSDKICEVVEYLYNNFYSRDRIPQVKDYVYDSYRESVTEDTELDWEKIVEKRLKNYVTQRMLIHIDFNIKESIDTSYIEEYVSKIDFSKQDLVSVLKLIPQIRSECIVKNREILLKDEIDAGVLINAYYLLKDYDNILTFPRTDISAYYLFAGFVYQDMGDEKNALKNLEIYFDMTRDRNYIKEISDMSGNRFNAFKVIVMLYEKLGVTDKIGKYIDLMTEYYKVNYLVADISEEPKSNGQRVQLEFIKKYKGEEV